MDYRENPPDSSKEAESPQVTGESSFSQEKPYRAPGLGAPETGAPGLGSSNNAGNDPPQGGVAPPPKAPPKEKRSFFSGFSIVCLILGVLVIGSCDVALNNFTSALGKKRHLALDGPGIAVLPILGEIFSTEWAVQAVSDFQRDKNVKALVIRVDSPGGVVAPCQELYAALNKFHKPKIVSMGNVAASGGFYIAITGDTIIANPGTLTGSIGVIMQTVEFSEAMNKLGVRSEVIKSGSFKDSGSPFRTMRAEEREFLQSLVMGVYEQFVRDVMASRRMMTEEAVRALADGRIFTGEEARLLGLIDELGSFEDAINLAAKLGGLPPDKEPQIVFASNNISIFDQVFMGSSLGFLNPLREKITPGLTLKFIYQPGLY
ncbi:MAG: signal peptide peptidase SppA [Deltaproteobacteria bacterium]|jgi:protease-4|nr:signal peptide peptidase SppA [Deltaproteobacteria bacterium]